MTQPVLANANTEQELILRRAAAVQTAETLANRLFAAAPGKGAEPPLDALRELGRLGLLQAPLRESDGGLGLGLGPGGHLPLLRILAALGGADLALGRIYEGHVNGLLLVQAYGTAQQVQTAARDAAEGKLFGVWNTGEPRPMHIAQEQHGLVLQGCKAFATGAGFLARPIVTAEHHGWQMTMPRMEDSAVAGAVRMDAESWQPLGMKSTQSLTVDFSGVPLAEADLLGRPGDFYRDPLFRGGAIRFAAVQAGALVRLAQTFAETLVQRGRQHDPYQVARLGHIRQLAQEAILWVRHGATEAEHGFSLEADAAITRRLVDAANMTRLGVQRAATELMTHLVAGVGAHGLLRPAPFERMVRDLTMYLRQPNPDGTLAEVGRHAFTSEATGYWAAPASVLSE